MDKLLILLDELIELEELSHEMEAFSESSITYLRKSNLEFIQSLTSNQN